MVNQFVCSNLSAIAGLASTIIGLMGSAAQGDSSSLTAAVEVALCQLIPLNIDLLLRFAGIYRGLKKRKEARGAKLKQHFALELVELRSLMS